MTDMSAFAKKTTPGQDSHRRQWILDTIRANQSLVGWVLTAISEGDLGDAKLALSELHKQDRDALLQKNGILTDAQLRYCNRESASSPEAT